MALTPQEEKAVNQQRANSYVTRTRVMITNLLNQMQLTDALLDEYTAGGFEDDEKLPEDGVFAGGTAPQGGPNSFVPNGDMSRDEFRACITSMQAIQAVMGQQAHLTNLLKGRKG